MKYLIMITAVTAVTLLGCHQKTIVKEKDYKAFLDPAYHETAVNKIQSEIDFWKLRLQNDTGSYVNMLQTGEQYLALFQLTGNINNLLTGDSLFQRASQKLNNSDPDILQASSRISIAKHEFVDAITRSETALKQKGAPYAHALLSFDAGMEIGQYHTAYSKLNQVIDRSSFNFLVRKARYEDHKGNIEEAIQSMEQAFDKIKHTNNVGLYTWTLSNLGDMYGHAGRITGAYTSYLKVLQKDPSHLHALKGIAWIAYAHDHNTKAALEILNFISLRSKDPHILLVKAEIMEYTGNAVVRSRLVSQFVSVTSSPHNGDMYNKYLIEILAEDPASQNKALALAQKEVSSRPTPETYSWLSWVYTKMGEHKKAYSLYKTYVEGRTFEPEALVKSAYILANAGQKDKAIYLFKECLKSSFELGPLKTKQLQNDVRKL